MARAISNGTGVLRTTSMQRYLVQLAAGATGPMKPVC